MNFRRIFGVNIPDTSQRDISMLVAMVKNIALFSRSTRLRVGCVLWDSYERNIVSLGYNGTAPGTDNTMELDNVTLDTVIHAEANACRKISWLRSRNLVCVLTHSPCLSCAKLLHARGIHRIYYLENYRDHAGVNYLRNHGIPVTRLVMS